MGLAFLAPVLGGIIEASFNVLGALSGPIAGLFILGIFVPKANKYAAIVSFMVADGGECVKKLSDALFYRRIFSQSDINHSLCNNCRWPVHHTTICQVLVSFSHHFHAKWHLQYANE